MSLVAPLPHTTVRYAIEVLVTGENEYDLTWRVCGEHMSPSRAAVALDEWLFEENPPGGEYRARSLTDGYTAARPHVQGEAA